MSIPLTLGVPHRPDPHALTAGLLNVRAADVNEFERYRSGLVDGPPVVSASSLPTFPAGARLGRIIVALDIDPDELRGHSNLPGYEAVRFHVDAESDQLEQATTLRLPSPLAVFPALGDMEAVDAADLVVGAHRTLGFGADEPPRRIADFLAVVAHSDVGFVARASNGREVVALLAATVAALRGNDIQAALAAPDVAAMRALVPEAAEAVRTVLLGIEIDAHAAESARHHLLEVGLAPPSEPTT